MFRMALWNYTTLTDVADAPRQPATALSGVNGAREVRHVP